MSTEPFLGEIAIYPLTFVPTGWASCDGQLLPVSQNTALFSLLGSAYGGNGSTTFALPNLNGAVAMGEGQGPGLSLRDHGETGGTAEVTLLESEIPLHSHGLQADSGTATSANPATAVPANTEADLYDTSGTTRQALGPSGSSLPHTNVQPTLVMRYCIALQGIYPPRW